MTWIWCGLAFIVGGAFGLGMMCCFIIASEEDRYIEKLEIKEADREE